MTDDHIRQAFEKWLDTTPHNPFTPKQDAFYAGYKAALASLEKDCTDCIHASLKESQEPCKSCAKEMIVFQNHEPLYRIKEVQAHDRQT